MLWGLPVLLWLSPQLVASVCSGGFLAWPYLDDWSGWWYGSFGVVVGCLSYGEWWSGTESKVLAFLLSARSYCRYGPMDGNLALSGTRTAWRCPRVFYCSALLHGACWVRFETKSSFFLMPSLQYLQTSAFVIHGGFLLHVTTSLKRNIAVASYLMSLDIGWNWLAKCERLVGSRFFEAAILSRKLSGRRKREVWQKFAGGIKRDVHELWLICHLILHFRLTTQVDQYFTETFTDFKTNTYARTLIHLMIRLLGWNSIHTGTRHNTSLKADNLHVAIQSSSAVSIFFFFFSTKCIKIITEYAYKLTLLSNFVIEINPQMMYGKNGKA